MHNYQQNWIGDNYSSIIVLRIFIPLVLLLCALFRPVGISFVYLLMFFIAPFVPLPKYKYIPKVLSAYFIILITLCVLILLGHGAIHLAIYAADYDINNIGTCSFLELILRNVGFIYFGKLRVTSIISWLTPDFVVLISAVIGYVLIKKLSGKSSVPSSDETESHIALESSQPKKSQSLIISMKLAKIVPIFCLLSLFFASALRPSAPGGFYFVMFLLCSTYWAAFRKLEKNFAILMRLIMVVFILHIVLIVSYQTPWVQSQLKNDTLAARLLGLESLIISSCETDIRITTFNDSLNIDSFLSPFIILVAYQIISLTSKCLLDKQVLRSKPKDEIEWTPLVELQRKSASQTRSQRESSPETAEEDAQKNQKTSTTFLDQIWYGITSIAGFIYQNSYIFTNIVMMTWSIVYHSWLTFIFLLWANALWMIPNQRKAMMRSSPFIVFYAEMLLLAQYLYGINLTNSELPSKVNTTGINLQQIGLQKPSEYHIQPSLPLMVKTIFTVMFWITLSQFCKESKDKKRSSVLKDMVQPFQVTVRTAINMKLESQPRSKFLKNAGVVIKYFLVRLWIWLLILVIFLCAITGSKMTGFRICYMGLFLFFLLVFQTSSKAWVNIMSGFWIFLIFYAMSILTLVYTYQFDKFNIYWRNYLNIPDNLQSDIGLEKYKTKDLFLHLLSPTTIVILTVIQLHYFHKNFVASLQETAEIPENVASLSSNEQNNTESGISENLAEISEADGVKKNFITRIKNYSKKAYAYLKSRIEELAKSFKEIFWTFLELHLIKMVYIVAFACCVSEPCVLNIVLAGLIAFGLLTSSKAQICISRIISLVVSIIILSKMVYQVAYLQHSHYDTKCANESNSNVTFNNAEWVGLSKATGEVTLVQLIKKYIVYMIMVTLHALATMRQNHMRLVKKIEKQNILFPTITRKDAEVNLIGLIKYLFNYGFYKFGLEITLIALVCLIAHRLDIMCLFYVGWLCLLMILSRKQCAKVWKLFQWFTAIAIFLQYVFFVGLPPGLCLVYPWEDSKYSSGLQTWALLPGNLRLNHVNDLFFDFMLLIFITCQKRVFHIEEKFENNPEFPGGSNKNVIEDIENYAENPTFDFITHVRNWLDISRYAIFCGFYWISLAIVFLSGTYITDLLAIGYLIGSFIFLWQGSDFYLLPIRSILKKWNYLLIYNVANITIKTVLQVAGCLFLESLEKHSCWLVHMLGLSCSHAVKDLDDIIDDNIDCPSTKSNMSLVWDSICFVFLIFQLRIFKSYYFCHVVNDTKANTILASRGAELIEELRHKQIEHKKQHEQQILKKIKMKMERIRETQQKLLKYENQTHADGIDETAPLALSSNLSSTQGSGYHTPIEDDESNMHLQIENLNIAKSSPHAATSPSSIAMTVSLDGYMEPKRFSFETTILDYSTKEPVENLPLPPLPIIQTNGKKPEEQLSTLNIDDVRQHRRQSSGNTVSWNEPVEILENDNSKLKNKDDIQDENLITNTDKPKKHNALNISYSHDGTCNVPRSSIDTSILRRRYSSTSRQELRRSSCISRPYSWGPLSNVYYLESLLSDISRPNSHGESIRAGDYYMFEHFDDKFELDLIEDEHDFLAEEGDISIAEKKMTRKKDLLSHEMLQRKASMHKSASEGEKSIIGEEEITSEIKDDEETTVKQRNYFVTLFERVLISVAIKLNKFSRHYRYVMKILEREKKILRESRDFANCLRAGTCQIWSQFLSLRKHLMQKTDEGSAVVSESNTGKDSLEENFTTEEHNIIIEVLISAWYAILSNTDLICYFVVFVNQVVNASLISLPLPLMVFMWGTLSLPRPTKTFWVTLITYTQSVVLIKCVFQFKLIWSNYIHLPNQPLSPAKIIGIELKKHYANFDLLLLLVLFLHRYILKSQGLWKSQYQEDILQEPSSLLLESEVKDSSSTTSNKGDLLIVEGTTSEEVTNFPHVTIEDNKDEKVPLHDLVKVASAKYFSSTRDFFIDLVNRARLATDVYALMFFCDFINFFVLLFGFTAFGTQQGDVQTYLQENKVPIPFLIMLLLQFILIVIDRALYLRKALVPKIIFHYLSVVGIHIWMFFVLPSITERSFYDSNPPIVFYIIKCIYLLLSSYQIKCGYPKRSLGNFLTKAFSLINMILFKIYMIIPFLYELRILLDWVCTDTTMTLFDWLKMEDIFSEIYFIKCSRMMEKDYPTIRARKKPMLAKILLGGTIILIIVISIWGPLCLFALGNTVGNTNLPYEVSAELRIGKYEPIYKVNNRESIHQFNDDTLFKFERQYYRNKSALMIISDYDAADVAAVALSSNSSLLWEISSPDRRQLINDLRSDRTITCRFSYSLTRIKPNKESQSTVSSEITFALDKNFTGRAALINMLEGHSVQKPIEDSFNTSLQPAPNTPPEQKPPAEETGRKELDAPPTQENKTLQKREAQSVLESVTIPSLLPKFIKVLNSGELVVISQFMPEQYSLYRPLNVKLNSDSRGLWWEVKEDCSDGFYNNNTLADFYNNCDSVVFYTFNDKKFPSTFSFLTAGGIIGIYTTFVLLASKVMKSFMAGGSRKIMFEELPYVDRVLQLCLDIYLVRESLEFELEEDLYAKLIFLYRSPETMIKWTRKRKENGDDDDDEDDEDNDQTERIEDEPSVSGVSLPRKRQIQKQ